MKIIAMRAIFLAGAASIAEAKIFEQMFPGHADYDIDEVNQALRSLDYQQGEIGVPGGQVTLTVPDGYFYLGLEDAQVVLSYLWGNPEGQSLGMLFPSNVTPWDETWGVELNFEGIG